MTEGLFFEVKKLLDNQPYLEISENGNEYVISGVYQYSLEFNGFIAQGDRKINLKVPKKFPDEIPTFYVFDYPEHIEHIYKDNSVCLATIGEIINFISENPSLIAFVDKFVNAFIFTIDWFEKYKTYPFGDRQHGFKGLLDYYLNDLKLTKNQYIEMVSIIYNDKYRGHLLCFCGSGKRLRVCHGRYILPIIQNSRFKHLFLVEAEMILTEDNKNGKHKSSK